jgi:hypothetical protein
VVLYANGAPEEIRTPDPQIRSLISAFFDRTHLHTLPYSRLRNKLLIDKGISHSSVL